MIPPHLAVPMVVGIERMSGRIAPADRLFRAHSSRLYASCCLAAVAGRAKRRETDAYRRERFTACADRHPVINVVRNGQSPLVGDAPFAHRMERELMVAKLLPLSGPVGPASHGDGPRAAGRVRTACDCLRRFAGAWKHPLRGFRQERGEAACCCSSWSPLFRPQYPPVH